ncbi:FmdE family protein [Pelosinus sp. IPA-1]|uniref:FmdE family protein n=1 Tax=Pelosinus sp. IPA-1 TaxID=3029569 RepID=UPI0024362591|nr:FmdE family protein [Pelosinus sp. IPA-1]GMB00994.1 tRNA CCA-pyrophosphorylase [Pelosinus sp. IPA-1]
MMQAKDYFEVGLKFHGHKCPAMPLGLRAGAAAMNALSVERSEDKELVMLVETGNDHAAGCFVDGLMTVTGCTYGKSNIQKLYYGKMAFTLIDTKKEKAVRVQLKTEFFGKMLQSPFVQQRKQGVPPQDVPANITDPLLEGVMNRAEEEFLVISPVFDYKFEKGKGIFDTDLCEACGERVFVHKLQNVKGKKVCIPCAEKLQ